MFASLRVPTPEDLKSWVWARHRHALQLPNAPGPETTPHWPTSHFTQLKIGRRQDAIVATYVVFSKPKALAPLLGCLRVPLIGSSV